MTDSETEMTESDRMKECFEKYHKATGRRYGIVIQTFGDPEAQMALGQNPYYYRLVDTFREFPNGRIFFDRDKAIRECNKLNHNYFLHEYLDKKKQKGARE